MTGIYQFAYEVQDTPGPGAPYNAGEDDPDSPETPHPSRAKMANDWKTCRDLFEGQRAVVEAGTRYLPRHPAEDREDYNHRLQHAEFFNAFKRTIIAGVGLLTQNPPKLSDDAPEDFIAEWENIDGAGTKGDVFVGRLCTDGTQTGLAGILVDYPTVSAPQLLSSDDEARRGLRPYWVRVCAEQFWSWRFTKVGGQTVLTQLVLREVVERPYGQFGTAFVTQFRVFRRPSFDTFDSNGVAITALSDRVEWEVWEKESSNKPAVKKDGGVMQGIDEIPFAPLVVGNDAEGFECTPPLMDLAWCNLAHYRVLTDRRNLEHVGCVPQPVRTGYKDSSEETSGVTKIGPNTLMDLPKGADFKFAEITGASFEPTEKDIEKLEKRMGALGMAFLSPDTRAAETAEAKRIDSTAQNASLSTVATAVQDCLNNAARLHAKFRKSATMASLEVNRQFEAIVMDTGLVSAFSDMEAKGQISRETMWAELQKGHILGEDFDAVKEQALLLKQQKAELALTGGADPTDPNHPSGKQPPNKFGGA